MVTAFITTQAQRFGRTSMISLASILRVFLRYLHRERILQRDISKLVEIPQNYRLADIPRSISWDSVQTMLDQVDRRMVRIAVADLKIPPGYSLACPTTHGIMRD